MTARTADVVVVGAGIAGISAAFHLAVERGVGEVAIVDPRPPLTLTSDKSTECYRNWWPNLPMVGLMNRSIDILEDLAARSDNVFGMTRRGYLFVTADETRFRRMIDEAHYTSTLGAGPVRIHPGPLPYRPSPADGYTGAPEGADILAGTDSLLQHFPYLTEKAVGGIHVRRAGWFSAQTLGVWMLDRARRHGARLLSDEVTGVRVTGSRVSGVDLAGGESLDTPVVVNAAGPLSHRVSSMAGLELPVYSEVHMKVAYRDHLGVVPRDAPMFIWSDTQTLDWSQEERDELERLGRSDLLEEMPVFCHGRPEGGADSPYLLGLWEYHHDVREPEWPLPDDDLYAETVMRGLSTMVPGLGTYLDGLPHSVVDGGYYSKTRENRPLVGPAGPDGFHLMAGMSGFGVMVAAGAGDLLARHVVGDPLPDYGAAFLLDRYDDAGYMKTIEREISTGQL